MKRTFAILFAVVLTLGGLVPRANAVGVFIEAGDRPYYTHGPHYYVGPSRYVWVPGHWGWRHHHHVWVHGHYIIG